MASFLRSPLRRGSMLERVTLASPAGCLLHSHISLPDAGHPVGSASPAWSLRGHHLLPKTRLLRLKDPQVGTSLGTLILGVSHPKPDPDF